MEKKTLTGYLLNLCILRDKQGVLCLFDGLLRVRVALFLRKSGSNGRKYGKADKHFHFCFWKHIESTTQIFANQITGQCQ